MPNTVTYHTLRAAYEQRYHEPSQQTPKDIARLWRTTHVTGDRGKNMPHDRLLDRVYLTICLMRRYDVNP